MAINHHSNNRGLRSAQGFTLIEILVAMIVLAIGLLSLAGLQLQTLRYTHSAGMRTIATTLASTISDRIRANRSGFEAGYYNAMTDATKNSVATATCFTTGCSTQAMAVLDIKMWYEAIGQVLPGGVGVVCIDSTPNDNDATITDPKCDNEPGATYAIKIWWNDDRSIETTNKKNITRFVTSFQP